MRESKTELPCIVLLLSGQDLCPSNSHSMTPVNVEEIRVCTGTDEWLQCLHFTVGFRCGHALSARQNSSMVAQHSAGPQRDQYMIHISKT